MQRSSQADAQRYALLPTDELGVEPKELVGEVNVHHGLFSPLWMRLWAIASVILAVLSYFVPNPASPTAPPVFSSRAARLAYAATLPRPSMYIGLSRLNRTTALAALPDEVTYFPHVFAPVSRLEPNKVWPTDGHERRTFNGVVSPGEPHVVIDGSSGTSMIMQFRVQDYGMERCSIAAILPPADAQIEVQNRTLLLGSARIKLDIWRLDTRGNMELDLTSLNWNTRPARSSLIATIDAEEGGEVHTSEFDCGASGSLNAFEIACSEPTERAEGCKIEFWQGQPEVVPRMAFVVVQKPSL